MSAYRGTPIEPQEAWGMLDRWKSARREIGVIFWGRTANLYTLAQIESAKAGRIELQGAAARASFKVAGASFRYGPMQTWPRWPAPPVVEVTALRAEFENGDYLVLAEGLAPHAVAPPALPG